MRPIFTMSARQVACTEGRPQPVRKLGEVASSDKGISKRLLLLFGER